MKGVMKRLTGLGFGLELSDAAKKFVAEKGYDPKFGARPLHRAIQKYLEDPLAEEILNQDVKEGDILIADLNEADQKIVFTKKQEPAPKKEKKPKA
jgi:ATP-dependent Clp protease ATP-binding subunit ClpC